MFMTKASQEFILDYKFCIQYLIQFRKNKDNIQAIFNLSSKINVINPIFAKKPGLCIK